MKFIYSLLLLSIVVLLHSCASYFGDSNDPDAKARQVASYELGWNQALAAYQEEFKNCYPIKNSFCVISADDTLIVDKAILVMRETRTLCLRDITVCNACEMANAAIKIANIIGGVEGLSVTAACSESLLVDDILRELENAPPIISEEPVL